MKQRALQLEAWIHSLPDWLASKTRILLITMSVTIFVLLTGAVMMKWMALDYPGLDLAIYNQVFWNTVHGAPFHLSIHPHLYLGDHMELFLVLLAPFYALFQHPITLLVLQNIALASSLFPAYLLFKRLLPRWLATLLALGFLLTPFLWNTALYEFHAVSFALPILLWALFAYETRRYVWFLVLSMLAITVREDIALIIAGIGIVAIIERRSIRWFLPPMLLGLIWFVVATQLSGIINQYGQYKYLVYYGHLGDSFGAILRNVFTNPGPFLTSLFGPQSLLFVLGLFLPVLYVSLLRPKWLIPLLPTLFAFLLSKETGEIVLRIHYPIAMLPFLFLALRDVLRALFDKQTPAGLLQKLHPYRGLIVVSLLVTFMYSLIVMSPVVGLVRDLPAQLRSERTRLFSVLTKNTPDGGRAAGYSFLPVLSSHETVVAMHYVFSGKQQFSAKPYEPPIVSSILLDTNDVLFYHSTNDVAGEKYQNGPERIAAYVEKNDLHVESAYDGVVQWTKSPEPVAVLTEKYTALPKTAKTVQDTSTATGIQLRGWETPSGSLVSETHNIHEEVFHTLPLTLYWERTGEVSEQRFFTLQLKDDSRILLEQRYTIAYGLEPPYTWEKSSIMGTRWVFLLPKTLPAGATITIIAEKLESDLTLSSTNGIEAFIKNRETNAPIELGTLQIPPAASTE
ncbi:MAG: DUF2079 domain-containing protein [Patescibacteria group bacterium]|jgi:uncharacterized membrane protein